MDEATGVKPRTSERHHYFLFCDFSGGFRWLAWAAPSLTSQRWDKRQSNQSIDSELIPIRLTSLETYINGNLLPATTQRYYTKPVWLGIRQTTALYGLTMGRSLPRRMFNLELGWLPLKQMFNSIQIIYFSHAKHKTMKSQWHIW